MQPPCTVRPPALPFANPSPSPFTQQHRPELTLLFELAFRLAPGHENAAMVDANRATVTVHHDATRRASAGVWAADTVQLAASTGNCLDCPVMRVG